LLLLLLFLPLCLLLLLLLLQWLSPVGELLPAQRSP
jgi:hypothetical protein